MAKRRKGRRSPMEIRYNGIWGEYSLNDRVHVEYVLTTVHFSEAKEKLHYIKPVREVLDIKNLPFEHLLQRDLDDARTAEEIINGYLAVEEMPAPLFFPPITVALLPQKDEGDSVGKFYPPLDKNVRNNDYGEYESLAFGDAFEVQIYLDEDGRKTQDCSLIIHPSLTHQLAIDGQHRLMAVKASVLGVEDIEDIYRPLYSDIKGVNLDGVHLPICFIYFPELNDKDTTGKNDDLILTSRRVFLDVNKNARKPARSREILLDDYDLVNIFVRNVFTAIKDNPGMLKLYHTEYDSPSGTSTMSRPLAIIDVYNLKDIISHLLLSGKTLSSAIERTGKPNYRHRDFLRHELEIEDKISSGFFRAYGINRSNIHPEELPPAVSKEIAIKCFQGFWGKTILETLENLYPHRVHLEAVTELKDWIDGKGMLSLPEKLAQAMLFDGQGLWWICRNSNAKQAKEAVQFADSWVKRFQDERARKYLKKSKNKFHLNDTQMVKTLYDVFTSKAFQIGLFMSISFLKQKLDVGAEDLPQLAREFTEAINARFEIKSVREVLFDRNNQSSIRWCYKDRKLAPSDWFFMRAVILGML